jgi:hypothetical protein
MNAMTRRDEIIFVGCGIEPIELCAPLFWLFLGVVDNWLKTSIQQFRPVRIHYPHAFNLPLKFPRLGRNIAIKPPSFQSDHDFHRVIIGSLATGRGISENGVQLKS